MQDRAKSGKASPAYPAGKLNSETERGGVGPRKPKHELGGVMMKDVRATLGRAMTFQNERFLVV